MKEFITYTLIFLNLGLCINYFLELKKHKASRPIVVLLSLYPISFLFKGFESYFAILIYFLAIISTLSAVILFGITLLKNEENKSYRNLMFVVPIFIIIQTLFRFNHYPGANIINYLALIPIIVGSFVAVKIRSEQAKLSNLFTFYLILNFYFYIQS